MVERDQRRQNDKTAGEEIVKGESETFEEPMNVELPEERERRFQRVGLSRLRIDWRGEDAMMMARVHQVVDTKLFEDFQDVYSIMFELYEVVREPVMDGDQPQLDQVGFPVWRRTPSGNYVEDWSKLTSRQRERFLFQITTRLFEWQQRAIAAWAEAMFAKAVWEEAFSKGYESLAGNKTVEARTSHAKVESADDRYFAIFVTYYSRKAESVVKTMELLSQRLKDVHVSNGSR